MAIERAATSDFRWDRWPARNRCSRPGEDVECSHLQQPERPLVPISASACVPRHSGGPPAIQLFGMLGQAV